MNTAMIPNARRMAIFALASANITNRKYVIVFNLIDNVKS